MFVVKRKLEVIATTMAAKHISEDGIAKLKDILEQQEFYASKDNADKVRDLDTEFHDIIYDDSFADPPQADEVQTGIAVS